MMNVLILNLAGEPGVARPAHACNTSFHVSIWLSISWKTSSNIFFCLMLSQER